MMADSSRDEPRVLVVGYAPELKGGVTQVTRVLMQSFKNMELHPTLYCYTPKYKAVILYLYSILHFVLKRVFLKKKRPDWLLLIIGSTGDAVRVLPFIWLGCLFNIKLCAQYHKSGDTIFTGISWSWLRKLVIKYLRKIRIHVFLSKRLKNGLEKIFPFPIESVVIPNALEKKWFDIQSLLLSERSRDIVFLGRWSYEKGVDDLVQCMAQFVSSVTCEMYANYVPVEDFRNCKVFPWVGEAEVMEIMRTAKLLVLPSYAEAYPTVLLEAAACGTPFVATDLPGIKDICEQSEGGAIFRVGNVTELQQHIENLLNDPERWNEMSQNGRLWVKSLAVDTIKKQWLEVFAC